MMFGATWRSDLRRVLVSQDRDHAGHGRGGRGVDAGDPATGDGGVDQGGVGEVGVAEFGGETCGAGRLGGAVNAVQRSPDNPSGGVVRVGALVSGGLRGGGGHAALPSVRSRRSTATMVRWARSILNVLPGKPVAGASSACAARRKDSSFAAAPSSTRSASNARHGLVPTPPSASRTAVMRPSSATIHRCGDGDEREGIGGAVAHLAVTRVRGDGQGGKLDGSDELVRGQFGLNMRGGSWQLVEVGERDASCAAGALHLDRRIQRRQCHRHVRWVRGHAVDARPEHRVATVEPIEGRASGAGVAFVACRRLVVEVQAPGALHQVAADGCHVAQLAGCAVQDRLGQHRVAGADERVLGEAAVAHHRADPDAAVGEFVDCVEWQAGDVDDRAGLLDALSHQVDEVGAAGEELCLGFGDDRLHGCVDVGGADVREALHRATSWIAATMPL